MPEPSASKVEVVSGELVDPQISPPVPSGGVSFVCIKTEIDTSKLTSSILGDIYTFLRHITGFSIRTKVVI